MCFLGSSNEPVKISSSRTPIYFMGFWNILIMMSDSVLVRGIYLKAGGVEDFSTWKIFDIFLLGKLLFLRTRPVITLREHEGVYQYGKQ